LENGSTLPKTFYKAEQTNVGVMAKERSENLLRSVCSIANHYDLISRELLGVLEDHPFNAHLFIVCRYYYGIHIITECPQFARNPEIEETGLAIDLNLMTKRYRLYSFL
jgi:hypothetical protein